MSNIIKNNPKISVIMPVYNTDKFVWEAIESILKQSFKDFEFIIIDDCSTDQSYQVCNEYAKNESRIRLYRNKENIWISETRNKLIELCKGEFIATQDSDDISVNNRLKLSFDFLIQNHDYAVVSGNNIIVNQVWKTIGARIYSNNIKKTILKKSPVSQPSSMFVKNVFIQVGWYDRSINYGEDYDLWLKIYSVGYKIKNLDKFLIKYRLHGNQTKSTKLRQTLKNTIFIQKRAINKYKIKASLSDYIYLFLEKCLLFLPEKFVLFFFKKTAYKNAK